ncbi:hypothetical protein FSO04_34060 [Paraburkholderia madseniana]|jgi:hypothetical protein|uniref:Uncharacterized protein n=1 Tax=Paraburkholderia madseniana TaxID=2599607 RepID=A0A6N6W796_9BURK|nr:hypothetical protein [Paraburkholderia madseniana]KAE8755440.1 hypothetical protein FSO04_34060 [Paraburkholderia madseniana]NPT69554.1 hypothetical protein [Paraburkholderia madseniana]
MSINAIDGVRVDFVTSRVTLVRRALADAQKIMWLADPNIAPVIHRTFASITVPYWDDSR